MRALVSTPSHITTTHNIKFQLGRFTESSSSAQVPLQTDQPSGKRSLSGATQQRDGFQIPHQGSEKAFLQPEGNKTDTKWCLKKLLLNDHFSELNCIYSTQQLSVRHHRGFKSSTQPQLCTVQADVAIPLFLLGTLPAPGPAETDAFPVSMAH